MISCIYATLQYFCSVFPSARVSVCPRCRCTTLILLAAVSALHTTVPPLPPEPRLRPPWFRRRRRLRSFCRNVSICMILAILLACAADCSRSLAGSGKSLGFYFTLKSSSSAHLARMKTTGAPHTGQFRR